MKSYSKLALLPMIALGVAITVAPLRAQVGGPYPKDPDSVEKPDVPKGKVTQMLNFKSKIFAGTDREWWIYVPAQYTADKPACVMIFQDGGGYKNNVPKVFDNLIAEKAMPVTVGVFIQPGNPLPDADRRGGIGRSFEYDTLSDQYSRFLLEEILPEVEKTVKLRHDAASRAVAGLSSGAICAFTVAWERPDQFSKVLSWIGSYTNLAPGKSGIGGGHNYPPMIRRTDPKPIRVFLQDGDHDLDNPYGNWPLANQEMAKALEFKHYDYKFVFGHGDHNPAHGYSILGESLRWLWRDYKAAASTAGTPEKTLPDGLKIQDLTVGTGKEAVKGSAVAVHYRGTLDDGTVFDESYKRGEPFLLVLGQGSVIKGWDEGLVGMKVGGKRRLTIPSALGYGASGQGKIPANATLHFDCELMDVQ